MAKSVRQAWNYRKNTPEGEDKDLRKVAEDNIKERNDLALQHLVHLQVERRLAPRTLALYAEAFARLQSFAVEQKLPLREVQVHHVRRWAASSSKTGAPNDEMGCVFGAKA